MSSVAPVKNLWSLTKNTIWGTPKKEGLPFELCIGYTDLPRFWKLSLGDVVTSSAGAVASSSAPVKAVYVATAKHLWIEFKCAWRTKEVLAAVASDPTQPTQLAFKRGWALVAHTATLVKLNGKPWCIITLYSDSLTPIGEKMKVKVICVGDPAWPKEYGRYNWKSVGAVTNSLCNKQKLKAAIDQLIAAINGREEDYDLGSSPTNWNMGLLACNCQSSTREFILRLIQNPVDADRYMYHLANSLILRWSPLTSLFRRWC